MDLQLQASVAGLVSGPSHPWIILSPPAKRGQNDEPRKLQTKHISVT